MKTVIDELALEADGPVIENRSTKAITKREIRRRNKLARLDRLKLMRRIGARRGEILSARKKAEMHLVNQKCIRNPVYFINNFVWTVDPRVGDEKRKTKNRIPLKLFPQQERLIAFFQRCNALETDGTVEKSRDQGFTWVSAAYAVWIWIFKPDTQVGFGSRLARNVYKKGDDGAIFSKLAYIIKNLPQWMIPLGYDENFHYNEMLLINPQNGSTIWGGSGDNMARGKRSEVFFADEHAFIPNAQKVDGALSQLARAVIYGSTPNGANSFFKRKVDNPHLEHIRLHWHDDPRKDQAWYEHQKKQYDAETVAREIDIDHNASVRGVAIDTKWIQAAIDWNPTPKQLELVNLVTIGGLDISVGGDEMPLTKRDGPLVSVVKYEEPTPDFNLSANWLIENFQNGSEVYYDDDGVGSTFGAALANALGPSGVWFSAYPVNSGGRASDKIYGYGNDGKPHQGFHKFANIKAELWALIRQRFINTYNFVVNGIDCDPNDMISLPNESAEDRKLCNQLGWYRFERASGGRTKMNDKKEFVNSPDYADSFCYSFMSELTKLEGAAGEYMGGVA